MAAATDAPTINHWYEIGHFERRWRYSSMAAAKATATTNHWNEIGDVERWQGHSKEM